MIFDKKCIVTMITVGSVLVLAASVALVFGLNITSRAPRQFTIDYNANTFLMDGVPFRYVSGSFHYFRALPETWRTKLRTMRAAGLNAVDTYVEWSLHNPKDGEYTFEGIADVENFIKIAQEEDLYVILRPGPYICAERDNGGLPYWLFKKYPNIKVRTNDEDYKKEVSIWFSKLMPKLQKYFYGNGGPIIMVQVENEYGIFHSCDKNYLNWLRDEFQIYVQEKALLFTTDIPDERISCGKIEGVFATTDFGIDRAHEMDKIWETLRTVQPNGPLVNSEFYPGWLTHWQEENQRRNADEVADTLKSMLEIGASVNFYMFFGGTNFGFTAGANDWGYGKYMADITSYDYDAPMDEAGDPTLKFVKIRNVIDQFFSLPAVSVPDPAPKMSLTAVDLKPIDLLLSESGRRNLVTKSQKARQPASFEELDQFSGLVIYEAQLPSLEIDPSLLTVNELADRAVVLIDQIFIGVLSRENGITALPISAGFGKILQIIVENQGRINFNKANDTKGILGKVEVQKFDGTKLEIVNWTSSSVPLEAQQISKLVDERKQEKVKIDSTGLLLQGPAIFYAEFTIIRDDIQDTYLDPSGWGKGVVFINGFNLGRYWPLVGPQITVYVPKDLLKKGVNRIVIVEYQKAPTDGRVSFTSTARLDGISTRDKTEL
ncbi:beta-galactosidase-like isoform X1 [Hermetia illucens]|uniref:beta-galactosidase-like isoform X1 n=1 Tax=Hermetia illucens TaxID=343691 RepID=UPI0018CC20C5|nr:beta-galactosidase-like isoform X1 [Hermetia illucens]